MSGRYCHGCSQVVAVDVNHKCGEYPAINPVPVEGVVLPEESSDLEPLDPDNANRFRMYDETVDEYRTVVHERDFEAIAIQLREAIAQRETAQKSLDETGIILGKICVYGTLVAGEKAIDPPAHASVDAILSQIKRAEKAEAALATEREVSSDLRENLSASIADAKLWRDNVATERARALQEAADAVKATTPIGSKQFCMTYSVAIGDAEDSILALIQK